MALETFGIVNANVSEMFTLMTAKYKDAIQAEPEPWARTLCGFTSTEALRLKYPIDLTVLDGFREWVGSRDVKDADIEAFFIDSKPFERTISVPLDVAKAPGEAQAYVNKVPALVRAAKTHPNRLIANLLMNGKTSTMCWDGQPLFSANHPVNPRDAKKGVQSNIFTGKPFNAENFAFARKTFRKFKAPDGKTSLGVRLTHVLGPTDLEEEFDKVLARNLIAEAFKSTVAPDTVAAASVSNNYAGGAIPVIAPELDAEPTVWYGVYSATGVNFAEIQMANNGEPAIQILGDGSEHATMKNEVLFTGKLFGNAGAAIPLAIVRFEG